MTIRKENSPHPIFQPIQAVDSTAVRYMLWAISRKCFIKPSGCWFYAGRRNEYGYGIFQIEAELHRVHRLVYEHCVGAVPDGMLVLHDCDHPPCCCPSHLHVGDKRDNMQECLQRTQKHNSVLRPEHVREIREAYKNRKATKKRLAERYGVSVDAISELLNGKTWGFIT